MSQGSKKRSILVVDDDDALRAVVIAHLEDLPYRMLEASGGWEALELVQKDSVDLVISDVRMPNGNGVELLERLQSLPKKVPCILMTGYADYTSRELIQKGALKVLSKPFVWDELLKEIEGALGKLKG